MWRLMHAFAGCLSEAAAKHLLGIATTPRRRYSVGVDCLPLLEVQQSIFPYCTPQGIGRAMLIRTVLPEIAPELVPPVWRNARY
jgi:hypothetical protein